MTSDTRPQGGTDEMQTTVRRAGRVVRHYGVITSSTSPAASVTVSLVKRGSRVYRQTLIRQLKLPPFHKETAALPQGKLPPFHKETAALPQGSCRPSIKKLPPFHPSTRKLPSARKLPPFHKETAALPQGNCRPSIRNLPPFHKETTALPQGNCLMAMKTSDEGSPRPADSSPP
ncbi:hypothetical protein ACOMHN_000327 [Nucella lapillus]